MAGMDLTQEEELGVFSLREAQLCQSTAAYQPRSRLFDSLGFGLQPFASGI